MDRFLLPGQCQYDGCTHCFWGRCRHSSANYEAWRATGRKYKARKAIFCILAAIDRFSWISWKVESRWGKLESRWGKSESYCGKQKGVVESRKALQKAERHCGKHKAVDESRKAIEKNWKAFEENRKASKKNWITSKENWISGEKNPNFPKRFSSFWQFWGLVLLPDLLPCARIDLLCWTQVLIT